MDRNHEVHAQAGPEKVRVRVLGPFPDDERHVRRQSTLTAGSTRRPGRRPRRARARSRCGRSGRRVGGQPDVEPPELRLAEHARRASSVAAPTASSSGTPSCVQVADRLDHRQHAAGEHAVRAAHGALVHLHVEVAEAVRRRRATPAAVIASVTSATRSRAARQTTRAVSGARWMPSRMIETTTSSRASAAPTMPGSRCRNGRIALKRWVTLRAPRSNAAFACAAVASRVAERHGDAALEQHGRSARRRPASSGASVISRTGPASSSRSSSAQVGIAPRRRLVRAEPVGREERAFEVHAEDPRPRARRSAPRASPRAPAPPGS